MSGFDCDFVEQPPESLQSKCPLCLLIVREPFQVTCCGKNFCKECFKKLKARKKSCPTCKQEEFESFPNKGLQQPLYGFRVFCSNKESGCAWEGELEQLDQHINSNPDKEKQLVGCTYTNVSCVYCEGQHQRQKIEEHQVSLCLKRPFTCLMCKEYKSTYADYVYYHRAECICRPVMCPNSCGADDLQHQHLEEHVSSQCPLTLVECEFSEIGCAAKVYRKDLPSHLTDNIVTHMSLLAKENRKLKLQLKEQQLKLEEQRKQMEDENNELRAIMKTSAHVPPIDFLCPAKSLIEDSSFWSSETFRIHNITGDLQLYAQVKLLQKTDGEGIVRQFKVIRVHVVSKSLYQPSSDMKLEVTVVLVDQDTGSQNLVFSVHPTHAVEFQPVEPDMSYLCGYNIKPCFVKDSCYLFRILKIST